MLLERKKFVSYICTGYTFRGMLPPSSFSWRLVVVLRCPADIQPLHKLKCYKMFSGIKSNILNFDSNGESDASRLWGSITKTVDQTSKEIVDPGSKFGVLWEPNENSDICRACQNKFQLMKIKHHCRNCAGLFCDDCSPLTTFGESTEKLRICTGCKRGECPGDQVKALIRKQLGDINGKDDAALVDKIHKKVAAKMNETLKQQPAPASAAVPITLKRGSAYPDTGATHTEESIPLSGYFEFFNKGTTICCLKVIAASTNQKFEIPRPSYLAVLPGGSVHGHIPTNAASVDLIVLYGNSAPFDSKKSINFDTRAPGTALDKIAESARIDKFPKIAYYTISCQDKNVLLKYKGNGFVEPRNGDSVRRVGIFGRLTGKTALANRIDYSSNVESLSLAFMLSS